MPRKMTPEENICILLTIIFDEGINKYEENFKKLILRLNEYYDTNKVDIINYFTIDTRTFLPFTILYLTLYALGTDFVRYLA